MKKFSNIDEKEIILKEQKPKMNSLVEHLINKNLQVAYNGDVDVAITKNFSIEGSDTLTEKLEQVIENFTKNVETSVKENLKYKFGSQYDQKTLNKEIKLLEDSIYLNITPFPQDIFSSEDYEMNEEIIILKSLNNIPTDYMDYVNLNNAQKFFENGNINLRYNDGIWELKFENNGDFGTNISSDNDKYKLFINENKDFVSDFLRATTQLIGSQNISLDKYFINLYK